MYTHSHTLYIHMHSCTYTHSHHTCEYHKLILNHIPSTVAESVECRPHGQEIGSYIPGSFKPMTYQIDPCSFLAWRYARTSTG